MWGLAVDTYARGLSVHDVKDALPDATGRPLLSRNGVSEPSETLWEDDKAFCGRDLSSFEVKCVFIDAVYEGLRQWGCSQGLLCAWAICRERRKVMLHLELRSRESYETCLSLIHGMVRHGLCTPLLVTTNGAPGLICAVEEVWGKNLRQQYLAHTPALAPSAREMRNIQDKVPCAAREEIKGRVQNVFYVPSLETAEDRAAEVLQEHEREYPAAMRSFHEDLDASLAYLHCPLTHHTAIPITNLLERASQQSRQRTKVIPHFFKDRVCLKLVFSVLWQTSQRWRRVTMTELQQQRLDQLRLELGLPLQDQ